MAAPTALHGIRRRPYNGLNLLLTAVPTAGGEPISAPNDRILNVRKLFHLVKVLCLRWTLGYSYLRIRFQQIVFAGGPGDKPHDRATISFLGCPSWRDNGIDGRPLVSVNVPWSTFSTEPSGRYLCKRECYSSLKSRRRQELLSRERPIVALSRITFVHHNHGFHPLFLFLYSCTCALRAVLTISHLIGRRDGPLQRVLAPSSFLATFPWRLRGVWCLSFPLILPPIDRASQPPHGIAFLPHMPPVRAYLQFVYLADDPPWC